MKRKQTMKRDRERDTEILRKAGKRKKI